MPDTDPRLLEALASLNQIGAAMNQLGSDETVSVESTLALIVESASRLVPDASAVIYSFDPARGEFDAASRVSAGKWDNAAPGDAPRADGLGHRALLQRKRMLSYEQANLQIHPVRAAAGARTMGCFPLIVAEKPVGALYVYLLEARPFSQLELLMLDNFVNLAAMAMYHAQNLARIKRELDRKQDELVRLRRAGLLISSRSRLEDTLKSILEMALDVTGAQFGIFRLLDRGGKSLVTGAVAGAEMSHPLVEALPVESDSVMSWVARNRQAIRIEDLKAAPWSQIYYPLDAQMEMRSELAAPLIGSNGRLEGVLNLESPAVGAFSEDDSHLLQALATQAVVAIQEVRLLDALQEVTRLLLNQPLPALLQRLSDLACELLDASASAIWRVEGSDLVYAASSGGYRHGERIPVVDSLAGQAVLGREAVVAHDLRADARFHRPDLAQTQDWKRALSVPLLVGEGREPLGAFSVYSSTASSGQFIESEWDKKVLVFLADFAVLAFQNTARQDDLRSAQEQRSVAETFAAVGDITSNLLHRLNNKIGTIPVRIQGIEDKCADVLQSNYYLAHNLKEIERCAADAMQSVRDSLSHLRPIRVEPVNVAARVAEAVKSAQLPDSVLVRTETLESLPVVIAGGSTLELVFANILENASDAMDGRGIITISGATGPSWVEIAISDNGPGIPPELHDHIFELNYSGRRVTRPGKLGFGLWWVKTLVKRLNGSVSVESDGQHGTTFRLRLPMTNQR